MPFAMYAIAILAIAIGAPMLVVALTTFGPDSDAHATWWLLGCFASVGAGFLILRAIPQ